MSRLAIVLGLAAIVGCHSHDHAGGDGHAHGGDHPPHADEEGPTIAITRWTDRSELFVELPAPEPGKPVAYHAHVTRLADHQAVREGTFRVRWKTASGVAAEATQDGVKRPGIFVFEAPAPAAGTYTLELEYEVDGRKDVFDGGPVVVASPPRAPDVEEPSGAITLLKETQWTIPFATAWAEERALAREVELPAGGSSTTRSGRSRRACASRRGTWSAPSRRPSPGTTSTASPPRWTRLASPRSSWSARSRASSRWCRRASCPSAG